ncbi:hypothetical protein EVAR_46299_1 [Eumeta japonica]|uniref:Uncharacterized protein n=1 Tax=Eumeta variegata TaxID=151549 RepID=A0A4C1XX39_EUMVA|nr:hypothetical protein EVAR_46299_1 [Eumeta japonica]
MFKTERSKKSIVDLEATTPYASVQISNFLYLYNSPSRGRVHEKRPTTGGEPSSPHDSATVQQKPTRMMGEKKARCDYEHATGPPAPRRRAPPH